MFKVTIITTRPNANAPFFIDSDAGQLYQAQLIATRSARPRSEDQPNAFLEFNKIESEDGLTLTIEYSFASGLGRDELYAENDAKAMEAGLLPFKQARESYNTTHGHTTVSSVEII